MLESYLFQGLNGDAVIRALLGFRASGKRQDCFEAANGLIAFARERALTQSTLKEYVLRAMLREEKLPDSKEWEDYFKHDLREIGEKLLFFDWDALCRDSGLLPVSRFPAKGEGGGLDSFTQSLRQLIDARDAEELYRGLMRHCKQFGTGETAAFAAFRLENGVLTGIRDIDPITFSDLTGLEYQKKTLLENTQAFVSGKPANNVLLAGDSGTGKSSSVKACLNRFKDQGLRLIEVGKEELIDLPVILKQIRGRELKYIIFVDDLSFESSDSSYKQLKSALDGQVEQHPDNVLIYATSNRRHLIRETWSEREGADGDDIHRSDTLSEKRSLSERFGITLFFLAPGQEEYLDIVAGILRGSGVEMDETARQEALAWAVGFHGRSGRTAKQFAASYLAARQ